MMTPRERVKAVYEGKTPDQVPLMLDLSHWYKKNNNVFFDLNGFTQVEQPLVDLHKQCGAVIYVETGSHIEIYYDDETVQSKSWTDKQGVYHTQISTPLGSITEERVFSRESYSYHIQKWLIHNIHDLTIMEYAMKRRKIRPCFDRYKAWSNAAGDLGFLYTFLSYSGLGFLISRFMGVEKTILAMYDYPDEVGSFIRSVNEINLRMLDDIISGPFDVLIVGDNHDSNVQSPNMFKKYTFDYYQEVTRRVHAHGKYVAAHVDGEMRGLLRLMAECGVDCIDAATPAPMFSLTPEQARQETGNNMILSGGIPATVFGSIGTDEEFVESVKRWLDTKEISSRLILAAGDQVPTDAPWYRIEMLTELIDQFGRY
jgi:hypothetical protein